MNKIIRLLYTYLPKKWILFLGKSNGLKFLRDLVLRPNKKEVIIDELVTWGRGKFYFFAPIKVATKAKNKGIENLLLKNTLQLFKNDNLTNPTILDVGSNYGFISLALQSNLTSQTSIFSFEPHPEIVKAFSRSILKNDIKNIILENVAVGNDNEQIEINLFGQTSNILDTGNKVVQKVKINQIKLDDYLLDRNIIPNFIKIDVDGYELNVLKGLQDTINKYKPIMVVETNDSEEVLQFLKNCNYKLLDLNLKEFECIPNNVFCIN